MKIARGGRSIVALSLALTFVILMLDIFYILPLLHLILFLSLLFLLLLTLFFRDPERKIGKGIVSPADGNVLKVGKIKDELIGDSYFVSIFMNLFDVHVNRAPIEGKVTYMKHYRGKHFPAFSEKYHKNEHLVTIIEGKSGKVKIIQTAGLLARRIVPYIKEGENVQKGQRIGIIRFGSRVDVYIPCSMVRKLYVEEGKRLKAGEDRIA